MDDGRLYDTPNAAVKCYVLHPYLKVLRDQTQRTEEDRLAEACGLARAINLEIAGSETLGLNKILPATYFGGGKAEQIKQFMQQHEARLLIVNADLSPGQQRNLENALKAKVIDRTGLILEIFGARARTAEGKLQVELAALTYQRSRLVRSWTHLERQRGGHGFLGGPGEKQLELDRRMLEARIEKIKIELMNVQRTRGLQRTARKRNHVPTIALIGYTNAGKSTLFNRLTAAKVVAQDMLFATLDPTIRPVTLPGGKQALLSDTVGFIANLPTMLVASFRATLEEVATADILLHVRDLSNSETEAQAKDVESVLLEMGLPETDWGPRLIEVWNKTDQLDPAVLDNLRHRAAANEIEGNPAVPISAISGQGLPELLNLIQKRLAEQANAQVYAIDLRPADGAGLAWLYQHGQVLLREEDTEKEILHIKCELNPNNYSKFMDKFSGSVIDIQPIAANLDIS
jgi:GTP-binding protein HflX